MTDNAASELPDADRVVIFSDGVFAIVITLLVIEIHRPDPCPGGLAAALVHGWPSYAAFVLAFVYVGVIWLNHHGIFQHIGRTDRTLNSINLGILGTSALMPFPAGVLAAAFQSGNLDDQRAAVVLYAAVAGLMSAAWLPLFPYLERRSALLRSPRSAGYFHRQATRPMIGVTAYIGAAAAGWFIAPLLAIIIFVAMIFYHAWTSEGSGDLDR